MSKLSKVHTRFLYVQWFAAGVEVSAEYREAILALLMGYAGHTDLLPNEAGVILSPSDYQILPTWPPK